MDQIGLYQIKKMTDIELISYTFEKIESFRMISRSDDFDKLRRAMFTLDPLIVEIKSRNMKINKKIFADRVLIKE